MADAPAPSRAHLKRALWLARAVMLWERSAGLWGPLLLGAGVIAVAGLWGAFDNGPAWMQTAAVACVLLIALVFAGLNATRLRWPTSEEALARVEADSPFEHAPLSSLEDRPAAGDPGLWALHQSRAAEAARKARVGRPSAGLAAADPFALRWALVIAAALALWARGPETAPRAIQAFRPVTQAVSFAGARVDSALGAMMGRDASK